MSLSRSYFRLFLIASIALVMLLPNCEFASCEISAEYARYVVGLAEESLEMAYLSVVGAERSGGDVRDLIVYLRVAVGYLSEAERALESGDYDGASLLAERVDEAAKDILLVAARVVGLASMQRRIAFGYQLFFSFGVFLVIVLFGFFGWRTFRGYYVHRLMGSRPEVSVDES
jgi:hypothetical protein